MKKLFKLIQKIHHHVDLAVGSVQSSSLPFGHFVQTDTHVQHRQANVVQMQMFCSNFMED